jgi:hypothetical protein
MPRPPRQEADPKIEPWTALKSHIYEIHAHQIETPLPNSNCSQSVTFDELTIKIANILQDGYVTRDLFGAQASVCKWMELDREIYSSASHGAPSRRLALRSSNRRQDDASGRASRLSMQDQVADFFLCKGIDLRNHHERTTHRKAPKR